MEATAWLNKTCHEGITSDGRAFRDVLYLPCLVETGVQLGARVFYFCGDAPAGGPEAMMNGLRDRGWQDAGSRLQVRDKQLRVRSDKWLLRARNPKLRRSVTILPASVWFGDVACDHLQARAAMVRLASEIAQRFDRSRMWLSPGRTGAEAWRRVTQDQFRPLPEELQSLIRHTSGQGRFECCPVADAIPALYQLDQRLAYAARCVGAIETGDEWRHEERPASGWPDRDAAPTNQGGSGFSLGDGFLGYTPARYHVRYQVPQNWSHVGLLPYREGQNTYWPTATGSRWTCWADASEIRLAIREGWNVEILQRVYAVKPEGRSTFYRPLKLWGERLIRLHDDLHADGAREDLAPLWHAAVRNILLHTIGWLAMRPTSVTREVDEWDEVPDENTARATARETSSGAVQYEEQGVLSPQAARVAHPELAAQVWGSTRASLLRSTITFEGERREVGALTLPRSDIVGMALDCLFLTRDPGWPDDGRPGRFRVKRHVPGPLPAPQTMGDLYRLTGETEGLEEQLEDLRQSAMEGPVE